MLYHQNSVTCWTALSYLTGVDEDHYNDAIMGTIASQITSLTIVYSIVYSDADQRKHQSSASLAFVRGIHRGPVNSPHKWPVTRKMLPFDDVIMLTAVTQTEYEGDSKSMVLCSIRDAPKNKCNVRHFIIPHPWLRWESCRRIGAWMSGNRCGSLPH